jgi:hypothetical protein
MFVFLVEGLSVEEASLIDQEQMRSENQLIPETCMPKEGKLGQDRRHES